MSKNKLYTLYTEADRALLAPVLDTLRAKGLHVSEASGRPGAGEVVLVGLSERFYADEAAVERLLGLLGAGAENVLPLQLDEADMPDAIKNALYARNIIPAAQRDAGLVAERILAALPQKKSRLPLILSVAGVLLLAVVGLLIWRGSRAGGGDTAPVMGGKPIVLPAGLTLEDLAKIKDVVLVGDQAEFYTGDDVAEIGLMPDWDYFAYRDYDEDGAHWYSREDGHEYSMTTYEDLRFLSLMPNLNQLHLALVKSDLLPDLSGAGMLRAVSLMECDIPDLSWLAGAPIQHADLINSTGSLSDFSPLTECGSLSSVHIDLINTRQADLSGFAPPNLDWLWINNGPDLQGQLDLSSLTACTRLRECQLDSELPITELSFLAEAKQLERLQLESLHQLRDLSVVKDLSALRHLEILDCDRIADFSPIANCGKLQSFRYRTEGFNVFRDASFLALLPELNAISLQNVDLQDVDFLRGPARRHASLDVDLTGNFADYSGLESCKNYKSLNLDPGDNTPFADIVPYLEGATVEHLSLRRFATVDLSTLPKVTQSVELDRCDITDLSTMPESWTAVSLNLNKCSQLRSLDGLQNQKAFGRGAGSLDIFLCPRLADFSALDGMRFHSLRITGGYALPSFDTLQLNELQLDSVADVTDLDFLSTLNNARSCNFSLVGLDELRNLSPLSRFHGDHLSVSPQLAEQAQDLVDAGNFREVRIEYPQGGWEMDNMEFSLLSLDELETLPKALLKRVERVCIVGDQVVDRDQYEIYEDWEHKNGSVPTLYLRERNTDELTPVVDGTVKDLSLFSELSGLKELELWAQPLETLDGIQNLSQLEDFTAQFCPALRDASALFSLQGLHGVCLEGSQISSIQGIQNLSELNWIDFSGTQVEDFSPLASCDFSWASEHGGLNLSLNGLNLDEAAFAALGNVPHYSNLAFDGEDPAAWQPALANSEIESFGGAGDFRSNEDLAAFAADHPELRNLWLGWMQEITDLRCLAPLENLERVSVNPNMREAIDSLNGVSYGFELRLEG